MRKRGCGLDKDPFIGATTGGRWKFTPLQRRESVLGKNSSLQEQQGHFIESIATTCRLRHSCGAGSASLTSPMRSNLASGPRHETQGPYPVRKNSASTPAGTSHDESDVQNVVQALPFVGYYTCEMHLLFVNI